MKLGEVAYVDGQILVKPGYGKNIASTRTIEGFNEYTSKQKSTNKSGVTSDYNIEHVEPKMSRTRLVSFVPNGL